MFGFGFDPLYLVFFLPGVALAMWAQWRVRSAFQEYSQVPTSRGLSGADIADAILRVNGIQDVHIEPTDGVLGDHYDPRTRTLRLSREVYLGRTVAAAGVAAHEVGHAIQHANHYVPLQVRSALVPPLMITNTIAMPTLMIGFVLAWAGSALGGPVIWLGVALFSVLVLFQLVTLPVELDASRRALNAIQRGRLVTSTELVGARKVLTAAALTYVAAAASSMLQLAYFVLRASSATSRREE
jgi:Zn-dependent membrane protease YugP